MKKIFLLPIVVLISQCATAPQAPSAETQFLKANPAVTIETSGDLYFEEQGQNVQMDFFGNCAPGQSMIYIEVDKKKSVAPCEKGRYRHSMNLPESFFEQKSSTQRSPSSSYSMKEVSAYHENHSKLSATSFILIDRKRREVKSVVNKQVKFEKIPTGEFEPVTQYNAFGSCTPGSVVNVEIKSPDRYGHPTSKYDDRKECQASVGYYFLSQVHGFPKKGTQFYIHEDTAANKGGRNPASNEKPKFKNVFNWKVEIPSQD